MLLGVIICAVSTSLAATNNYSMPIDGMNAAMDGYIDFLEGPLTIQDKVYYSASVYGSDAYQIANTTNNYVQAGSDKKNLMKRYVYFNHPVNVSGENCGYGGSYGYLNMSCEGTVDIIYSY